MDPTLLIGDIVERDAGEKNPVEFTGDTISSTGFPQHKRRWKNSAFKQRRAAAAAGETPSVPSKPQPDKDTSISRESVQAPDLETVEKQRIDQENRQKLADMSPTEIAEAQQEIMNGLNPALIQRLLQRAVVDEPLGPSPFDPPPSETPQSSEPVSVPEIMVEKTSKSVSFAPKPTVSSEDEEKTLHESQRASSTTRASSTSSKKIADNYNEDQAPAQIPSDIFPITDLPKSLHFPVPRGRTDLDPDDPDFLNTLHDKYFPNLPADPSKLAWMAPLPTQDSTADKDSSYYPHPEIPLTALRFDFAGRFLSPRVSRSIPSSKGLHHHGDAPEAAGYTITELARLARSAVPAQRCVAFQTLGRILYRLGHGEWGKTENHPIAQAIWSQVKEGKVLETLTEASMREGGHRGSRAYATEALWLFEKGGWREQFKGR